MRSGIALRVTEGDRLPGTLTRCSVSVICKEKIRASSAGALNGWRVGIAMPASDSVFCVLTQHIASAM
jgi:hypothetical protein